MVYQSPGKNFNLFIKLRYTSTQLQNTFSKITIVKNMCESVSMSFNNITTTVLFFFLFCYFNDVFKFITVFHIRHSLVLSLLFMRSWKGYSVSLQVYDKLHYFLFSLWMPLWKIINTIILKYLMKSNSIAYEKKINIAFWMNATRFDDETT